MRSPQRVLPSEACCPRAAPSLLARGGRGAVPGAGCRPPSPACPARWGRSPRAARPAAERLVWDRAAQPGGRAAERRQPQPGRRRSHTHTGSQTDTRTRTHVAARPARGTPSTAGPRPPARPAPAAPERPRGTPTAAAPRLPRAPPVPARGGRGAGARRFRGGRKAASRAGRRGALRRLSPRKKPSRARPCSPGFGTEKVPRYGQKGSPRVSQHHKSDNNAEQTEYHSRAISMSNIPLLSSSICKCELQTKLPAKSTERLVHTFTPTPVTGYHHTAIPLAEPFHPSPCLQMEMIPIGPRCPCK